MAAYSKTSALLTRPAFGQVRGDLGRRRSGRDLEGDRRRVVADRIGQLAAQRARRPGRPRSPSAAPGGSTPRSRPPMADRRPEQDRSGDDDQERKTGDGEHGAQPGRAAGAVGARPGSPSNAALGTRRSALRAQRTSLGPRWPRIAHAMHLAARVELGLQDQPGRLAIDGPPASLACRRRRRAARRVRGVRVQGWPLRPATCSARPGTRLGCPSGARTPVAQARVAAACAPSVPSVFSGSPSTTPSKPRSTTSRSRRRRSAASLPRGTVGRPRATPDSVSPDARPIRRSPRSMPSSLTGRSGSGG